jgi:hypothetical protein
MKNYALSIFSMIICCSCASDNQTQIRKVDGDLQSLRHEIEFIPDSKDDEAHFRATLKNTSDRNMNIIVNDRGFHSTLCARSATGKNYELFEKNYLDLLQTTTWFDPTKELTAGSTIQWKIPLSSVVTVQHEPITQASLKGVSISSDLSVSGVKIKSKPIRIQ